MIVVCPNCGAKYRLSEAVLSRRARLRCAECDNRWVPVLEAGDPEPPRPAAPPSPPRPVTEADEEAAFAAVQAQLQARWQPEPAPVDATAPGDTPIDPVAGAIDPAADAIDDDDPGSPRGRGGEVVRWLVAGIAGIALSVAAAGLWLGQIDPDAVPFVAPLLDRLQSPSPLQLTVAGQTTALPSGRLLLEVTGTIRNETGGVVPVPPLRASLASPAGVVLRWTMASPATILLPGQEVAFSATVTGFPPEARQITVRAGR